MLLITSLWSLPMLTWLMNVTSVTMSGLLRVQSISVFVTPFGLFHIHLLPAFLEQGVHDFVLKCHKIMLLIYDVTWVGTL